MPVSVRDALSVGRALLPVLSSFFALMTWFLHTEINAAMAPIQAELKTVAVNVEFLKKQTGTDESAVNDVRKRLDKIEDTIKEESLHKSF